MKVDEDQCIEINILEKNYDGYSLHENIKEAVGCINQIRWGDYMTKMKKL